MKKLVIVADWAQDTLYQQEVRTAVEGFSNRPTEVRVSFVHSTPSSIHTSYLASQVVQTEERYGRPLETVILLSTDVREDISLPSDDTKGAPFIIVRLKSGIYLLGPNAGYNFALLHDHIDVVYTYPVTSMNSTYEARDTYARIASLLMEALEDDMELEEGHYNMIPALSGYYVGHVDAFGNILTTIPATDLKGSLSIGDTTTIRINDQVQKVRYMENLFDGEPDELILFPGMAGELHDPYLSLSAWSSFSPEAKTGKDFFDNIRPGQEITLEK